jgi:hypothetical protein
MSKYGLLMFFIIYLTLYSIIAESVGLAATDTTTDVSLIAGTGNFLDFTADVFGMFGKLITFQVTGMPAMVILFTVYPAVVGIIFIIVALIRGT